MPDPTPELVDPAAPPTLAELDAQIAADEAAAAHPPDAGPAALEVATPAPVTITPGLTPGLDIVPAVNELASLAQMAVTLAAAQLVPKALQNRPNDVFLVLLTARDTGVSLTTAIREFHPIDGKVTMSPKVKLALVRSSGLGDPFPHQPRRAVLNPSTGELEPKFCDCGADDPANNADRATWHAYRTDAPGVLYSSTFTHAEAVAADIARKDNWQHYAARMLSWRAVGYLLDDAFPEVGTGLYSPDELGAVTDDTGNPIIDVIGSAEPLAGTAAPRGHSRDDKAAEEAAAAELEAGRTALADRIADLDDDVRAAVVTRWRADNNLRRVEVLDRGQVRRANALVDAVERDAANPPQDAGTPEPVPAPTEPAAALPAPAPAASEAPSVTDATDDAFPGLAAELNDAIAADVPTELPAGDSTGVTARHAARVDVETEVARMGGAAIRRDLEDAGITGTGIPDHPTARRQLLTLVRYVDAEVATETETATVMAALTGSPA